jgi:fibronectin type 3 domain-containing protein
MSFLKLNIYRKAVGSNFKFIGSIKGKGQVEFRDEGLNKNTLYVYRAQVERQEYFKKKLWVERSGFSNEVTCKTLDEPPLAPALVKVEPLSFDKILVVWQDNSDNEDEFLILRKEDKEEFFVDIKGMIGPNQTSYVDEGLEPLTTYCYKVVARNELGSSETETSKKATTFEMPPKVPVLLRVEPIKIGKEDTHCSVKIVWNDESDNEIAFKILRRSESERTFKVIKVIEVCPIASRKKVRNLEYIDSGLCPLTRYTYCVVSRSSHYDSKYSNYKTITTHQTIPQKPTYLKATRIGASKIKLEWIDNSNNEKGFVLQRRVLSKRNFIEIKRLKANSTSFLDEEASPQDMYEYRVAAWNFKGTSPYSSFIVGSYEPDGFEVIVHPNPARILKSVKFFYFLPEDAKIRISIYDVNGKMVASFVVFGKKKEWNCYTWDGKTFFGKIHEGVFECKLTAISIESKKRWHKIEKILFIK